MKYLQLLGAVIIFSSGYYLLSGDSRPADTSSPTPQAGGGQPAVSENNMTKVSPTIETDSRPISSQKPRQNLEQAKSNDSLEQLPGEVRDGFSAEIEKLEREIKESQSTSPANWFYAVEDVYQQVSEKSSGSYVSSVHCAERVCKVVVEHAGAEAKQQFDQSERPVEEMARAVDGSDNDREEENFDTDDRLREKPRFNTVENLTISGTEVGDYAPHTHTYYQYSEEPTGETVMYIVKSDIPSDPLAVEQFILDKKNNLN